MGAMLFLREVYANIDIWIEMFKTGWTSVTHAEGLQCPLMSTSNDQLQEVKSYDSQG
jgi:hypothetical protein